MGGVQTEDPLRMNQDVDKLGPPVCTGPKQEEDPTWGGFYLLGKFGEAPARVT